MICFNFVIACPLYCFNVDVFGVFFIFGKKLSRAYVFVYITCRIEIKFLLTYQISRLSTTFVQVLNIISVHWASPGATINMKVFSYHSITKSDLLCIFVCFCHLGFFFKQKHHYIKIRSPHLLPFFHWLFCSRR